MEKKQFTLQDLRNAFVAGESFEGDTISVDMDEKDEVTEPDFGEWVKEAYDIDVTTNETDTKEVEFEEYLKEEADEIMDLIYIKTKSGFNIGIDFNYLDVNGNFKIELPTGEVIDTANIKEI